MAGIAGPSPGDGEGMEVSAAPGPGPEPSTAGRVEGSLPAGFFEVRKFAFKIVMAALNSVMVFKSLSD